MSKYAEGTQVPIERSKAEVEKILVRFGADQFASGWMDKRAVISFRMNDRHIKISMPLLPSDKSMTASSQETAARENRRCWRSMVLYVKAKLESVQSGIVSFETAFMAHVVLPGGATVGEAIIPQIENAYKTGKMPPLLGYSTSG